MRGVVQRLISQDRLIAAPAVEYLGHILPNSVFAPFEREFDANRFVNWRLFGEYSGGAVQEHLVILGHLKGAVLRGLPDGGGHGEACRARLQPLHPGYARSLASGRIGRIEAEQLREQFGRSLVALL